MPEAHPYKYIVPKFENRPVITLSETNSYKKGLDVSFTVTTTRPASNFQAFGLPPGFDINSSSGLISGIPTKSGSYTSKLEASSVSGTYTKDINFIITDFSNWEYSTTINFPGFSNQSVLYDFPVYVELNTSIPGFSYDQFASPYGYDLRFLDNNGSRELKYEPVKWNPYGVSSFWVLMPEFDQNTSIFAIWGNNEAIQQPNYRKDGSVWSNYHAVWHMDGTSDTTVKESKISAHAIPYNFDELRVPGLFGTAASFDGVDDYIDLPITVHPQEGTEQITISFWSFGGDQLDSSSRTSILESGLHNAGLSIFIFLLIQDFIGKLDMIIQSIVLINLLRIPMVSGIIGLFKKDVNAGTMAVFRNGIKWHEGFNKTRPIGGEVDIFRLGASRTGWNRWHGLLDELRISLSIEDEAFILASYESQKPGSTFLSIDQVVGPPTLINNQVAEGFVKDSNFSYSVKVFPSATEFSAIGLPPGISINTSNGEIYGDPAPLQGGMFQVTVTAKNAFGQDQAVVLLSIFDDSGFSHSIELGCNDYNGSSTLNDFPLLVRLDNSVPNFSLKSFSSEYCYDLRFYDEQSAN